MGEAQLKVRLGVFLIVAHFFAIVLIVVLHFMGGFLFEEMTTAVALVAPLFAGYTTLIIKYIIDSRRDVVPVQKPVTSVFAFVSFLTPALFVFAIYALIILKALNVGFDSFDQFKILLGLVEAAFAVYLGQIVYAMFREEGAPASK
jgi:hypothetical protein